MLNLKKKLMIINRVITREVTLKMELEGKREKEN